jgi:hypothetical protein
MCLESRGFSPGKKKLQNKVLVVTVRWQHVACAVSAEMQMTVWPEKRTVLSRALTAANVVFTSRSSRPHRLMSSGLVRESLEKVAVLRL